jgi:hypothetical protein
MKPANHDARRRGSGRAKPLKIIYKQIEELKLDPGNPRVHSKGQIGQIASSIRIFGFNVPVLVDRDRNVVCGHGRLLACHELGITRGAYPVPRSPSRGCPSVPRYRSPAPGRARTPCNLSSPPAPGAPVLPLVAGLSRPLWLDDRPLLRQVADEPSQTAPHRDRSG